MHDNKSVDYSEKHAARKPRYFYSTIHLLLVHVRLTWRPTLRPRAFPNKHEATRYYPYNVSTTRYYCHIHRYSYERMQLLLILLNNNTTRAVRRTEEGWCFSLADAAIRHNGEMPPCRLAPFTVLTVALRSMSYPNPKEQQWSSSSSSGIIVVTPWVVQARTCASWGYRPYVPATILPVVALLHVLRRYRLFPTAPKQLQLRRFIRQPRHFFTASTEHAGYIR